MERRLASALIALRRIVRAAEFSARDLARTSGVTPSQMVVMRIIEREGDLGAGAIAASARLGQATLTALLDKLEARGAVRRRRDEADRRRVTVSLTEAGREILRAAPDGLQQRFASRFGQLQDWEQAGLVAALERIAVMMDAGDIDASPIFDVGSIDRPAEREDGL